LQRPATTASRLLMKVVKSIKAGAINGIKITMTLAKIIVPVYFFVVLLQQTPLFKIISRYFEPWMKLFGLPGKAALPFVLGNGINIYAPLGAIKQLGLTPKELTIIATMLCFSHSLFIETAIIKKMGLSIWPIIAIRVASAVLVGIFLNNIL